MKKILLKLNSLFLALVIVSACSPSKKSGEEAATEASDSSAQKKYNLYKAPASFDYPNAKLELTGNLDKLDTGNNTFSFNVTDYELGVPTPDAAERGIANSAKGQHIHFIVDNDPYSAHYEPEFSKKLEPGKHVILAFLSRSYHESVKNGNSYILKEVTVGDETDTTGSFDMNGQHLFYSRPKGTYSGTDTEKLMIDFFLINTSISGDGNKVKATINGEEEYMITEWAPYFVEGLGKGEITIKLELVDKDGNLIPGPFNSVERKVTLE